MIVAYFLVATGASASFPFVTLFLVQVIDAPPLSASLFFLSALPGPLLTVATGRLSDTIGERLTLARIAMFWVSCGWIAMALANSLSLALAISVIFLNLIGTIGAQLVVIYRITLDESGAGSVGSSTGMFRSAYSAGYVVGPIIGAAVASIGGLRIALGAAGVLFGLAALVVGGQRLPSLRHPYSDMNSSPKRQWIAPWVVSVLAFSVLTSIVMAGDGMKLTLLPLYVVTDLHLPIAALGSLFTASALIELAAMPLVGWVTDKVGLKAAAAAGFMVGTLDYGLLSISDRLWQLYLVQIIHTLVLGVLFTTGPLIVQRLAARSAIGYATSIYLSGQSVALPLGSAGAAFALVILGLPHAFIVPAAACAFSAITLSRLRIPLVSPAEQPH